MADKKIRKAPYFYVLQDEILITDFTEDWFESMMSSSEEFRGISSDKKKGINTMEGRPYCKVPLELVVTNDMETREEFILIIIATWIYTYSKATHTVSVKKILDTFAEIENKEEVFKALDKYGNEFCLSYVEYKDKFKRIKRQIKFDFDKYVLLLNKEEEEKAVEEIVEVDFGEYTYEESDSWKKIEELENKIWG